MANSHFHGSVSNAHDFSLELTAEEFVRTSGLCPGDPGDHSESDHSEQELDPANADIAQDLLQAPSGLK